MAEIEIEAVSQASKVETKSSISSFISPETSTPSSSVTTSENAEGNCQQKCTHWPFYLVPLTSINCVTHTQCFILKLCQSFCFNVQTILRQYSVLRLSYYFLGLSQSENRNMQSELHSKVRCKVVNFNLMCHLAKVKNYYFQLGYPIPL